MKVKFWEEAPEEQSATRLVFLIGSVWLMGLTSYLTITKIATLAEAGLFFSVQFALIAGSKLVQKAQEAKPDLPKDPNKTNEAPLP